MKNAIGAVFTLVVLVLSLSTSSVMAKGEQAAITLFTKAGPVLVAVVHGDQSVGGDVRYHNEFARRVALFYPKVSTAGVLRPGYFDGEGARSPGSARGRKDNYTRNAVDMIADAILAQRKAHGFTKVILVGHSGGAAIVGALMGLRPGVAETAVLVSCPCDIGRWRRHVDARNGGRDGGENDWHRSLSAIDYVAGVASDARIVAITSSNDGLTPPWLGRDYIAAAQAAGVNAEFALAGPTGHFLWNMEYSVIRLLGDELERLQRD